MTLKQKIANKEVLIILDKLNLKDKIPKDVLISMERNQEKNWEFIYKDGLELSKQKLTRQSIILLTSIYFIYICEDNDERERLKKIYTENERKNREEILNKLSNLNGNS